VRIIPSVIDLLPNLSQVEWIVITTTIFMLIHHKDRDSTKNNNK